MLDSYKKALDLSENFLPLIIIGDGEEFNNIKTWITDHNLEENIHLKGAIFDTNELEQYFRQAYACISPGQAGLSVLTSMGNGTPFITKRSAITGGEIFNIKNKVNGITYLEDNELVDILLDINSNKKKYIKMGKNARSFYLNERMPEKMIARLILAIEYALNNK